MREIKFRAWQENRSQMWMWNDYKHGLWEFFKDLQADDILMQYTGLKDKNGVEVYEGDIVNVENEVVGEIKMTFYSWVVQLDKTKITLWDIHFEDIVIEVIGNIWENADLRERMGK